jgi:uncharacterized protein YkuJ
MNHRKCNTLNKTLAKEHTRRQFEHNGISVTEYIILNHSPDMGICIWDRGEDYPFLTRTFSTHPRHESIQEILIGTSRRAIIMLFDSLDWEEARQQYNSELKVGSDS